ncbi:MAG: PASTA domain-containing protein, partial [Bacteroidota bacterium]
MDSLKYYLREIWLFLSSPIFLINFAKMVAVVLGLALLTGWALRCHTRHGESVQLNDFTGKHLTDAKRESRDKGFRFEVIDSIWQEGKPGGIIIKQTPNPLSRVKEGRKIYVTVTQWNAEMVRLPLLVESSYDYDRYAAKLAKRSIKARIKERVFDRRQAENTILYLYYEGKKVDETDIKNGFEVPMGATLEFVVTERLTNELQVPDLVCMNFSAAEFLVSNSNLNIGEVVADATVTDRNVAY